ncbi:protein FAM207A isoform X1 [Astyanax mexicanus]|uniref:protein FAM207A isoform X1 n=1 Tax=Astyanax mexicanus TaxID=7994 RepID=UPI0020CB208F|nr:protein FAM207A isoform X1 [Astyanax mexicanus]
MVGKIKRVRQKLHHIAVRVQAETGPGNRLEKAPGPAEIKPLIKPQTQPQTQVQDLKAFSFPKGIFAGTKITPEALVQTLKVEEPSPVLPTKQAGEVQKAGKEEKKQQSKKEKIKERRQRWLNKISSIKVAREEQVALERRKATPVVGDMRVLADALPELTQLLPTIRSASNTSARRQKGPVRKKSEPTDYSQMKPAQKRKLLETEASRFSEAMKDPTFKSNPLAAIGEHLRKRLRQEDEQS